MAENEKGPDRDFQRRVLAAIEKPQKSRIIAIINSSFFIWLLSAIFLTLGSFFLSARRECTDKAEKFVTDYAKLNSELLGRRASLVAAIKASNKMDDVKAASKTLRASSEHVMIQSISLSGTASPRLIS
jgi:hypothetical protein